MVQGVMRWVSYGAVLAGVSFLVLLSSRQRQSNRLVNGSKVLLIAVTPFVVGSVVNRWLGLGHEGQGFVEVPIQSYYFVFQAAVVAIIGLTLEKSIRSIDILAAATISIASTALFNTRIGDSVLLAKERIVIFLPALAVTTYLTCKSLIGSSEIQIALSRRWTLLLVVFLTLLLAFRVDGLETEGAWFHVSYFSGVIQGIKSGGLLLWDTPSQYGFLNLLIPASIPGLSAEYSFLLFQALLLFGVSLTVILSFIRLAPSAFGLLLGAVFAVIFFFADPSLVGPQPFPSSSVMRFGPSLLLLLFLSLRSATRASTLTRDTTLALVVAIAVLWSFESAFYSLFIFGMWTLAKMTSSIRRNESLWVQLRPQLFSVLSIITLIVLYSLYVLVRAGGFPNWRWFYLPASKFAAGFGQLPTDLWGAVWLILVSILGCLLLVIDASDSERASCFASVGALLGWLTYYVGRSHSSNIIAMLPLIFVALVIPTLKVASNYSKLQSHSVLELKKVISVPLSVIAVLSGVVVAEVIANPLLPAVVAKARPLPLEPVYETAASFPNSLEQLLGSAELKRIPVAYQGYMGMLPRLPDSLKERVDSGGSWLPLPLGLLEEPIPESVRSQMLERRFKRSPMSGYFIWHKSMSHPGRAELWLAEITRTHDCKVLAEDADWQVSECLARTK